MAGESSGVVAGSLRARGGGRQRRRGDDGEKQKAAELHGTGQREAGRQGKVGSPVGSQVWDMQACSSMFGLELAWAGLHRALQVTPHVRQVGSRRFGLGAVASYFSGNLQ